jgi:hypothetical protein
MALSQKTKQAKALKKQKKKKIKLKQKYHNNHNQQSIISVKSGEVHQCYISQPTSRCPFYHVLISRINEETNTIISVTFAINPNSSIEDVYKMVDDIPAFYHLIDYNIYNDGLPLNQTSPEFGKKIILQAVAHAKSNGYKIHPNYDVLKEIFFDIDETIVSNITFEFES